MICAGAEGAAGLCIRDRIGAAVAKPPSAPCPRKLAWAIGPATAPAEPRALPIVAAGPKPPPPSAAKGAAPLAAGIARLAPATGAISPAPVAPAAPAPAAAGPNAAKNCGIRLPASLRVLPP